MQYIDWDILRRGLLGKISDEESLLLDSWLNANPDNKTYFDNFKRYYHKSEDTKVNFDKNYKIFKEKLEAKKVKKIKPKFNRFMQIAASIVIIASISLTFLYYNPLILQEENLAILEQSETKNITLIAGDGETYDLSQEESHSTIAENKDIQLDENMADYSKQMVKQQSILKKVEYHKLIVPVGMKYNLTLPDGSKVHLNSDTELKYPTEFVDGFPRKVYVKGEAYFDVKYNKQSPFIVVADYIEVRNYGTEYNVNNRNSDRIATTLVEGSISISDTKKPKEFFIKPNQQAVVVKEERKVKISNVNVNQYLGWRNGLFIFENESLENIINELHLEYNIAFTTSNKAKLNQRFTSYIPRYENFEEVLKVIENTGKVKFKVDHETVTIE